MSQSINRDGDGMPETKERKSIAGISIQGEMTIYQAAELKQTLLGALEQVDELEVNLADVRELDTAGVQILLLVKAVAEEKHRTLRLVAHSPEVLEVFETFNLASYFGDQLVISS